MLQHMQLESDRRHCKFIGGYNLLKSSIVKKKIIKNKVLTDIIVQEFQRRFSFKNS